MADLLTNATDDAVSAGIVATGPVLVTVTGVMPLGKVRITGDIGGGEANAYVHEGGDPTSFARLEFTAGVTFKAYLENTKGHPDTDVTVTYIYVA